MTTHLHGSRARSLEPSDVNLCRSSENVIQALDHGIRGSVGGASWLSNRHCCGPIVARTRAISACKLVTVPVVISPAPATTVVGALALNRFGQCLLGDLCLCQPSRLRFLFGLYRLSCELLPLLHDLCLPHLHAHARDVAKRFCQKGATAEELCHRAEGSCMRTVAARDVGSSGFASWSRPSSPTTLLAGGRAGHTWRR